MQVRNSSKGIHPTIFQQMINQKLEVVFFIVALVTTNLLQTCKKIFPHVEVFMTTVTDRGPNVGHSVDFNFRDVSKTAVGAGPPRWR